MLGWDTETPGGYVGLLCSSDGLEVETHATVPLLDALFARGYAYDYNVFWNVRFDFGAIVKPWVVERSVALKANHRRRMALDKELRLLDAKRFVEGEPTHDDRLRARALKREIATLESVEHFDLGVYRVLYIPKKGFRVTRTRRQRGRNSVTFFDAMPWYATGIEEAAGLDRISRRYLGEHKTEADEGIDRAAIGSVPGYYEAHRDAIKRYCRHDAELTARLFALTVEGFSNLDIPFPKEPWSRASVGREILKRSGVLEATRARYAKLRLTPHATFWERAFAGACILTRAAGSWPDVSRWDINSAYPYGMIDFPSLDGAYLVTWGSPEFSSCYFRFYKVRLVPTPRRALHDRDRANERLVYHDGGPMRVAYVTQHDLDAFDAYGDRYEILDGVGVVCPSDDKPLSFVADLYRRKSEVGARFGKESVEYLNVKIPMNGIYGILTQSKPREGRYTNLIYGAYITALTRKMLWLKAKELTERGGTVLSYMTDGLFVADLPSLPHPSDELGGWDVEEPSLVTLFANGLYVHKGKLKRRGAPYLDVGGLMACERTEVTTTKSRPLGLKQAIIQGRPEDIGIFFDESKTFNPSSMLEESGLRVPDDLRSAPLSSFFTRSWLLEHRTADEPLPVRAAPGLARRALR